MESDDFVKRIAISFRGPPHWMPINFNVEHMNNDVVANHRPFLWKSFEDAADRLALKLQIDEIRKLEGQGDTMDCIFFCGENVDDFEPFVEYLHSKRLLLRNFWVGSAYGIIQTDSDKAALRVRESISQEQFFKGNYKTMFLSSSILQQHDSNILFEPECNDLKRPYLRILFTEAYLLEDCIGFPTYILLPAEQKISTNVLWTRFGSYLMNRGGDGIVVNLVKHECVKNPEKAQPFYRLTYHCRVTLEATPTTSIAVCEKLAHIASTFVDVTAMLPTCDFDGLSPEECDVISLSTFILSFHTDGISADSFYKELLGEDNSLARNKLLSEVKNVFNLESMRKRGKEHKSTRIIAKFTQPRPDNSKVTMINDKKGEFFF